MKEKPSNPSVSSSVTVNFCKVVVIPSEGVSRSFRSFSALKHQMSISILRSFWRGKQLACALLLQMRFITKSWPEVSRFENGRKVPPVARLAAASDFNDMPLLRSAIVQQVCSIGPYVANSYRDASKTIQKSCDPARSFSAALVEYHNTRFNRLIVRCTFYRLWRGTPYDYLRLTVVCYGQVPSTEKRA